MHPNNVAPRHPVSLQTITLSQPTGRAPTSQESTSHQRSQSRVRPPQVPLVDVRNQAPWALARGAPSRVLRRVFCSTVPRGCSRKHPSVELRELARARTDASPGTRRCSSLSCAPSAGDGWSLCNDDIDKTSLAVQSQSQKRERPLPSSRAACARNVFPACPPLVHPLVRRTACAAVAALLLGLVALSRFCHVWETRSLAEISRKHTISPGHGTSPNRVNPPPPPLFLLWQHPRFEKTSLPQYNTTIPRTLHCMRRWWFGGDRTVGDSYCRPQSHTTCLGEHAWWRWRLSSRFLRVYGKLSAHGMRLGRAPRRCLPTELPWVS